MPRRPLAIALFAAVALVAMVASVPSVEARSSPICTQGLTKLEVDPRGLLPLAAGNPIGPATAAALRFEKTSSKPQVVSAMLARLDRERGPQARYECGTRAWRRTIVVYVTDRAALPAQSASQRIFFVGRFKTGYKVWQVVH